MSISGRCYHKFHHNIVVIDLGKKTWSGPHASMFLIGSPSLQPIYRTYPRMWWQGAGRGWSRVHARISSATAPSKNILYRLKILHIFCTPLGNG